LLDARATAQADLDAAHVDPNHEGDVPSWEDNHALGASETSFGTFGGSGVAHRQFDS
jgi:hypothetical protein